MARRRGRYAGPRRGTFWVDHIINQTIANGGTFNDGLDGAIDADEKKGLTLTRTIVEVHAMPVATGAGGNLHLAVFLCEQDAFAAGAVPDVEDENEEPGWVWRSMQPVFTSVVNDRAQITRFHADLSSQRKYPGEDYSLIMVGSSPSSTSTFNVDGLVRMLFKRA